MPFVFSSPQLDPKQLVFDTTTFMLLDSADRIISIRPAPSRKSVIATLPLHTSFFSHFPLGEWDKQAIARRRSSLEGGSLLLCSRGRPILLLFHFYAETQLTLVAFPSGTVKTLLSAPAKLFGNLPHVSFAPSATLQSRMMEDQELILLNDYLDALHHPFLMYRPHAEQGISLTRFSICIKLLSDLFGMQLSQDLSLLLCGTLHNFLPAFAIGALTAIMLTANRLATERKLTLYGDWQDPYGALLYASFPCATPEPHPFELEGLRQTAYVKGLHIAIQADRDQMLFCIALCQSELSSQGIKANQTEEAPFPIPIEETEAQEVCASRRTGISQISQAQKQALLGKDV